MHTYAIARSRANGIRQMLSHYLRVAWKEIQSDDYARRFELIFYSCSGIKELKYTSFKQVGFP